MYIVLICWVREQQHCGPNEILRFQEKRIKCITFVKLLPSRVTIKFEKCLHCKNKNVSYNITLLEMQSNLSQITSNKSYFAVSVLCISESALHFCHYIPL